MLVLFCQGCVGKPLPGTEVRIVAQDKYGNDQVS